MPGISTTLFMKHLRNQIAAELHNHGLSIDRAADSRQHFVIFKNEANNNASNSSASTTSTLSSSPAPTGLPPLPPTTRRTPQRRKRTRPQTKKKSPKYKKQRVHDKAGVLYTGLDVSLKFSAWVVKNSVTILKFFHNLFLLLQENGDRVMNMLLIIKNYKSTYGHEFDEYQILDFIIEKELETFITKPGSRTSTRKAFENLIVDCLTKKYIDYVVNDLFESEEPPSNAALMYLTNHGNQRATRFIADLCLPNVSTKLDLD